MSFTDLRNELRSKYGVKDEEDEKKSSSPQQHWERVTGPEWDSAEEKNSIRMPTSSFKTLREELMHKYNPSSFVDEDYISSFLSEYEKYNGIVEDEYKGIKFSNAKKVTESNIHTAYDLRKRAQAIQKYLEQNKSAYGKDYDSVYSYMDNAVKGLDQYYKAFNDAEDYWSQWETEEDEKAAKAKAEADAKMWEELSGGYDPTKDKQEGQAGWEEYLALQERIEQNRQEEEENKKWYEKLADYIGDIGQDSSLPLHTTETVKQGYRDQEARMKKPDERWTEEQQLTYGYLWKQSRTSAEEYAYAVNNMLNTQQEQEALQKIMEWSTSNFGSGAAQTVGAILTAPLGMADYLGDVIAQGTLGYIPESDGSITPFEYSQAVAGSIGQHLNKEYGTLDERIPIIGGKGLGDAYGLGTSVVQSSLAAFSGGQAQALVTFFGSAAAAGIDDALSRGANGNQAVALGSMMGLAEGLAEMIGVDNLMKIGSSATGKQLVWNLLKQGGAEGIEEGVTSVLNNFADNLIMGDKSNFNILVTKYIAQGLSEEEAKKKAWLGMAEDIAYDMVGGFVSGEVHAGPLTTMSYANAQRQYAKTGSTIMNADGGVDALLNLANEVAGVSSESMQNTLAKQTGKVEKKATSRNVGRLYDTVQTANDQANAPANQADIAKSLMRKGFNSETANDIAEALVASYNGQELTKAQSKLLKSVNDNKVVKDAVANIMDNAKSTMGQRSQNIRDFRKDVAVGGFAKAAGMSVDDAEKIIDGTFTSEAENGSESHYEVSEDGKTYLKSSPDKAINISGIASINDGSMTLLTEDGNTVNAEDVDYGSRSDALVYEAVASLEGIIDTDTANKLAKHLLKLGGATSDAYVNGIVQAYTYGYYGYGREAMTSKETLSATLTEEQRNVAYGRGEQYRNAKTTSAQAEARSATVAKNATVDKKKATAPDGTQYKNVRFEGKVKKWSKKQKAEVEFIDFIASNFSGNTVRVFESYKTKDGKYVYEDNNGNIHAAPNGMYIDSTGDIYLDLNAGNHGEGLVMNTFAHELYHHIKKRSPAKARELAEFLVKELGYESVEEAVQRQISKAERAGHGVDYFMKENGLARSAAERLVYDRAFDDFIADSLETMFTEGDAIGKLQKLKSQDEGLFNMIKNFIDKWVKKLRRFYKDHSTISIEGDMVRQMEKFEQIQQMFMEALVDAGENYQASLTPGEESIVVNENGDPVAYSTDDGSVLLSMRTYEEEGRDEFRKYLQKCVSSKKLTKAEMQEMMDGIEDIYMTCKEFKDKYAPFSTWSDAAVVRDTYGKPVFSVVTPNGDYKMNLDFSLVCKKRRTLDAVFNEMSKRGIIDNFELGQKSVVKINEIIRKYGLETACALCFVDAKRFRQASMADSFTRLYNELVLSLVPEDQRSSIEHFNFSGYETIQKVADGIHTWDSSKLDFSHINEVLKNYGDGTVEYKAAKYIKSHAEGRKLLLRGDFMSSQGFDAVKTQNPDVLKLYNSKKGTGGPKAAFGDVQYMNEIIKKARFWTPKKAYEVGGIRIQSFSDYVPRMVFDYVQMVYDLAATKLPAHAYSKEALFVKQFGLTGIKINMSLIPAIAEGGIAPGLDANGNYVWAGESFDFETAKEIQNAEGYSENCGTICVGVSDRHIRKLLSDPDIRMVIPYHKSGLNPIVAHMNKIAEFADYTNKQNTTVKGTGTKAEKHFDFNKALHDMGENADPRAVIQQYFDWCDDNGYDPKFAEFRDHPNYYKLIEDFTLYDKDGKYVPQREVRAVFPNESSAFGSMKDLIKSGLEEDAIVEGKRDKSLSAIVDEIQRTIPKTEAEIAEEQVSQADRDLEADVKLSDRGYDFTKSFAEQIDDYKAGVFPQNDTLIVGTTPNVFLKIGLNRLPVTYARGHLKDVLKGTKVDHDFGEAILKQLPKAIKKPVAVIASQTQTSTSLVAILELSHGGKQIISAVRIDGDGMQNGIQIDTNAVTTMHKRGNAITLLANAIQEEASGSVGVYYLDKNKTTRLLQHQGLQLPNILQNSSGYIHSITDSNSPVKPKLGSVLESRQFLRWFGDWKNAPGKASKVVNKDGSPLVMYHGTNADFNTFDRNKIGSSGAGKYLGYGFNFASSEDTAKNYGAKNVMPVYLNIRNGLSSSEKTMRLNQLSSIIRKLDSDIEDISYSVVWDYSSTGYNITPRDSAGDIAAKYNKALREATRSIYDYAESDADIYSSISVSSTDSDAVIEAFKGVGYDGALWYRDDGSIQYAITFDSSQSKSIYNIGTYSEETGNIYYSDRDTESVSNRSLLANALEGAAKNDIEKQKIQEYKGKIDLINAEERKLGELNEKIKELSFAKGQRDTKAIRDLQFEAKQTANRISTYDKQLLRLEASKPLQDVLTREKKAAYQRAEQKGKEALAAYREKATKTQRELMDRWQESRKKGIESREKTAMKHKIQNVVGELNNLLLSNDKKRHVPDSLKKAVADALALVNMDTVGAEERAAKYAALIAKETDPDKIDAYTVTMENILRQGEKMGQRLKELRDAYEEIQNSDDPDIANGYDPVISGCIKELAESIGDTSLKDMSIEQLEDVYSMYKMVLTRVRDANKSLIDSIKENISSRASAVIGQVRDVGGEHKDRASILDPVRAFFWNNAKPVYAMERIGSSAFTEAYNNVRKGEDTWAKDVTEARAYYLDKSNKYGYDSWDFDKKYTFKSTSDIEFELTLEQVMALYAYSKRDQAFEHLRLGGFVFDSNIETYKETVEEKDGKVKQKKSILKYKVNTADAHQLTPETLADIIGTLSSEQKSFVDEMQDYLSTVMGAKGNEVTMKMYGVKLFKEKFYFPLKSAKQFMFEQNEVSGEVKIKNSGFTNKTKPKANNPIILNNFMDVWANHVNDMSMYHSFVLPLEDFNRIFNYNSPKKEGVPPVSVKGTIQSAYSPAAVSYVKNLITDLNGGARSDSTTGFINKMMGLFKKGSVFASLSVVVQQPSAIARAAALVNTKYFIGPKVDHKRHKALWEEVKQYAPVAIIKEMGYFDTNMGKSTQDFILSKEYSGFKEKMSALVKDSGYRDEILSKAPALADELAWCSIWEAVKREMHDKHPGLDVKSEAFLQKAGERFTEVITKTQVYDSVLSRSALMRSKDTGMKMATAFMAEPTTSINMIADALLKGKRGNWKYARAAIGAVIASQILNSILVSFVYAGRDDDEDETYLEKYIGSLTGEIVDSLNPAGYIPFIKDIMSIVQGYDVERSDMAVISDLWNAIQNLSKDNVSAYRKVEGFAGSIAQIFGLPVKNIMRDARGIFQTVTSFGNGQQTTAAGIGYAIKGAITGKTVSDQQQLYEAYLSGDQAQIARVEERFEDQKAINAAIRKALRENDPRIKEAAAEKVNGDLDDYLKIAKQIIKEKNFSQDDVVAAINAEINAMTSSGSTSSSTKASGMFKAEDFAVAISQGDTAMANAVKTDIIQTAQKNGKSAEEAEKSFISSATSACKDLFDAGDMTEGEAINALTNFCGKTEEEAASKVQYWVFKQDYPDVYVDDAWIDEYYEEVAYSGIEIDVFVEYRNQVKDITGEGKKEERMAVINSMPISNAQKDALYYAEGWAAGKIHEAPWR